MAYTSRNIGSVVITYNPEPDFQQRLRRITNQVARTVIVDNGSVQAVVDMLKSLPEDMNIELILNHDNLGVAHALNQGVLWATENGFEWVLTMDQDSVVENDSVDKLAAILHLPHPETDIGMIGSNYCDQYGNKYWEPKANKKFSWLERPFVITSGSLISVKAFFDIGGFRDDLFIDLVDHDYCIRLRQQGYLVGMSTEPLMTHSIGNKTRHKFFGVYLYTSNHPSFRRYFMTRNRMALVKKYSLSESMFVMSELSKMIMDVMTIILFEEEKTQKIRAMVIGLRDGFTGRMGKFMS